MKKTFFAHFLTAALIAVGAMTVSAADPKTAETDNSRLEGAKTCYIENMIVEVNVGRRISGGEELSAEQIKAIRKESIEWLNEDLLPFLKKNNILDEWVTMQYDKDIRELYEKIAKSKSMDDLVKKAKEGTALTKLRYPKSFARYNTPECVMVMRKLQERIMRAMIK